MTHGQNCCCTLCNEQRQPRKYIDLELGTIRVGFGDGKPITVSGPQKNLKRWATADLEALIKRQEQRLADCREDLAELEKWEQP